jgi:hypothetical protein
MNDNIIIERLDRYIFYLCIEFPSIDILAHCCVLWDLLLSEPFVLLYVKITVHK